MAETDAAEKWLYDKISPLGAVTALNGVYADMAKQGTATPYVVFQQQSARDLVPLGGARIWSELEYLVRVITQGSSLVPIEAAADAIDAALHAQAGPVTGGGFVQECFRVREYRAAYLNAGVQVRELGGVYRLRVQ